LFFSPRQNNTKQYPLRLLPLSAVARRRHSSGDFDALDDRLAFGWPLPLARVEFADRGDSFAGEQHGQVLKVLALIMKAE